MPEQSREFPHIYLPGNGESQAYTNPSQGGGGNKAVPDRDRFVHAQTLEQSIGVALQDAQNQLESHDSEVDAQEPGFYLEFKMKADKANAFEKLENRTKKIELVAVKQLADNTEEVSATVFVPQGAANHFLEKVKKYRDEETNTGRPKNEDLVSRIEDVQIAKVSSLFTDDPSFFPDEGQEVWWEVWLRKERRSVFDSTVRKLKIQMKDKRLHFPEHEVVLVMSDITLMERIIKKSDAIAELRISKDTPSFFLEMDNREQTEWANALTSQISAPGEDAVSICILDSGATRMHPLLEPALALESMHTVEPSWGVNDNPAGTGHGTAMAGIALYPDLSEALASNEDIELLHCLETVKILPPSGANEPDLYGAITEQGVLLPKIQAPHRRRIYCMAVTSSTGVTNIGSPSSWSAAVDQICFNDGELRQLMIIAAGNIGQDIFSGDYLNINDLEPVENPSQAWNALVVGAYTEKVNITHSSYAGWKPLAPCGDLSPRSRTSVLWEPQWPIRPDIVFEGGNFAFDGQRPAIPIDDLSLLTTYYQPNRKSFVYMCDTSSATALASHMAARIMTEHPEYNPETIRALIVHSAEWTPAMCEHFDGASSKAAKRLLVRRYGYGVPDLERALQSAKNDLTLVNEDKLQPFSLEGGSIKTKNMNLHSLPWPSEDLEKLGEAEVELKITLSYFIEPNPGERGWAYKHRYASHGLRFKVKGSLESKDDFKWRINEAARKKEDKAVVSNTAEEKKWYLGPNTRDCGSIHCDTWKGTAAELAQKDSVAVFPVSGWWKDKKYLNKYERAVDYSLIISIRLPEVDVDIYTPVANMTSPTVPVGNVI